MAEDREKLVTIRTYQERTEAELAKDYLESCDIDAVISGDDAGGMMPNMTSNIGLARLLVRPDDAEEAERLLVDAEEKGDYLEDEEEDEEEEFDEDYEDEDEDEDEDEEDFEDYEDEDEEEDEEEYEDEEDYEDNEDEDDDDRY
jgi:hypothetical protein